MHWKHLTHLANILQLIISFVGVCFIFKKYIVFFYCLLVVPALAVKFVVAALSNVCPPTSEQGYH